MTSDTETPHAEQNGQEQEAMLALSQAFLRNFPRDAARKLEMMSEENASAILENYPQDLAGSIWKLLSPAVRQSIIASLSDERAGYLLSALDAGPCATTLSGLDSAAQEHLLNLMPAAQARELKELLAYSIDSAGHLMDTKVLAFDSDMLAKDVLRQVKAATGFYRRRIYVLDEEMRLKGQIDLERLLSADEEANLSSLCQPSLYFAFALDSKDDVAEKLRHDTIDVLPILDINHHLLGVIRGAVTNQALKEDFAGDLQTMVGASRDERALSSSWTAVKKRQPWLQINMLTGFLAATVVGLFENTIAQITALAVLMPVVAGQSGNTGAQALAVTMRGLTLREITTRHWLKVMFKEASAGLINGLAIALTCSLGVFVWSGSTGLALVIALSMVISMTIAGMSGALVPIVLRKAGLDPAQSSSIVLTTVTDIAGFMSFLGIATLLASLIK